MSWSCRLIALGMVLLIAACQRPPAPPPADSAPPTISELEAARQALAVANWAAAAPHLRAALTQDPESLFLHYNLATCASWLDQTDEAEREFQWVRDHAPSDSDEATAARRWLATREKATETPPGEVDARAVGDSSVHGIVTWGEPPVPQRRMQLLLMGLPNTPTKDGRYALRTDDDGGYTFQRIPPGAYKLEVLLMMKPRWRLKLALEPGQDLVVDLTPDNSVPRRDDFAPAP